MKRNFKIVLRKDAMMGIVWFHFFILKLYGIVWLIFLTLSLNPGDRKVFFSLLTHREMYFKLPYVGYFSSFIAAEKSYYLVGLFFSFQFWPVRVASNDWNLTKIFFKQRKEIFKKIAHKTGTLFDQYECRKMKFSKVGRL